nr:Rpn family recombination-promoting nuclease/putative transposase [uncultured Treponema sp.]
MSTTNRKYKDSVFVDLFSEDEKAKENFLSLYNALHNTHLPLSCPVENIRLDNVMYMNIINDVSCLVDNKIIVLAEHQSTINENMPLRFLQYIARLYEKLQAPADRYLRKLSKIPTPEFYVFYNGLEDYPESTMLKLSDAFMTKLDTLPLELEVKVYNINKSKGSEVLSRCKTLDEYSLFVEEVRVQTQRDPENGFTNAVKICIEKGILKEYLQRKSREVINMLLAEYDYDTDIAVQREESLRIGIQQGIKQGLQQGIQQGIQQGFSDGTYQAKREMVKTMLTMGYLLDDICKIAGLSKADVAALQ